MERYCVYLCFLLGFASCFFIGIRGELSEMSAEFVYEMLSSRMNVDVNLLRKSLSYMRIRIDKLDRAINKITETMKAEFGNIGDDLDNQEEHKGTTIIGDNDSLPDASNDAEVKGKHVKDKAEQDTVNFASPNESVSLNTTTIMTRVNMLMQIVEINKKQNDDQCKLIEQTVGSYRRDTLKRFSDLKESIPVKQMSVAFMAELSEPLPNPRNGLVILFDRIHTNVGNCYNSRSGIFTAPISGTYNFNVIATAHPGSRDNWLHLRIKKNGVTVGYVYLDHQDRYWLRRSTDITIQVNKGDKLWVQAEDGKGRRKLAGNHFHTHFSGFLIQSN